MDYIKFEDIPEEFVGVATFMGIDINLLSFAMNMGG